MKYIKQYETSDNTYNITSSLIGAYGAYIQLQYNSVVDDDNELFYAWINWIDSHIGKIIKITRDDILIQYENVPDRIKYRFNFNPNFNSKPKIYYYKLTLKSLPKYFIGKTPEDVALQVNANKFNI